MLARPSRIWWSRDAEGSRPPRRRPRRRRIAASAAERSAAPAEDRGEAEERAADGDPGAVALAARCGSAAFARGRQLRRALLCIVHVAHDRLIARGFETQIAGQRGDREVRAE